MPKKRKYGRKVVNVDDTAVGSTQRPDRLLPEPEIFVTCPFCLSPSKTARLKAFGFKGMLTIYCGSCSTRVFASTSRGSVGLFALTKLLDLQGYGEQVASAIKVVAAAEQAKLLRKIRDGATAKILGEAVQEIRTKRRARRTSLLG